MSDLEDLESLEINLKGDRLGSARRNRQLLKLQRRMTTKALDRPLWKKQLAASNARKGKKR